MRKKFEQQRELGATYISEVKIDKKSRHELAQLLAGLQYIFVTPSINKQVFEILEDKILANKNTTGRLGMSLSQRDPFGVGNISTRSDAPQS